MNHILLLGYFFALMVGMWAAVTSHQFYKIHNYPFLRFLVRYIICLNIALFIYFSVTYLRINFPGSQFSDANSVFYAIMYLLSILVWLGCIHSFIHLILGLKERKSAPNIIRIFYVGFSIVGLMCVIGITSYIYTGSNKLNVGTYVGLMLITIITFISGAAGLLKHKMPGPKSGKLKSVRSFGWLNLVVFIFFFSPPFLSGTIKITVLSCAVISINLVPIIWLKYFFQRHYLQFSPNETLPPLEVVTQKFQLSPREREVMGLILQGSSNQEIEKTLFISYNTVKNHIYNIYRKLGVKSRGQMIRLVLDARKYEGKGNSTDL